MGTLALLVALALFGVYVFVIGFILGCEVEHRLERREREDLT